MTILELKELLLLANKEQKNENYEQLNKLSNQIIDSIHSIKADNENNDIELDTLIELNSLYQEALYLIGISKYIMGNYIESIEVLLSSLEITKTKDLAMFEAKCFNLLGNNYNNIGSYEQSLFYFEKSLNFFEKISDQSGKATIISNIGMVYHDLGKYEKSLGYLSNALFIQEELKDNVKIAHIYGSLGNTYFGLSMYDKALEYYSKELVLNQELGNEKRTGMVLGNIGNVYIKLKRNESALEFHSKALIIHEKYENKKDIAITTGNIGTVYFELKMYDKALEFQKKALALSKELAIKRPIAYWLEGIGNTLLSMGSLDEAFEYLLEALDLRKNILKSNEGVTSTLISISKFYSQKNNYIKAIEILSEAITLSSEIGEKSEICLAHSELANVYRRTQQWENADKHFRLFYELEKELLNENVKKQTESFEFIRKYAEREKQLAVERAEAATVKRILHNILPVNIADRIIKQETFIADHFHSVSVLFMDLVGFTSLASIAPPKQLVYLLDAIFQKADEVVETFGLEKIKTIGDGYLAVANVTSPLEEHQKATALAALQLIETMRDFAVNIPSDLGDIEWIKDMNDLEIRIGIHTGEVVAGIIGKNKYTYDLWGDAVNIASRMESNSEAGRIHISEEFAKSIEQNPEFSIIPRGEINIKGKGTMNTYWLEKGI